MAQQKKHRIAFHLETTAKRMALHEAICRCPKCKESTLVRHPERRIVSAKRARTLRRRGESVWFDHNLPSGKARYSWLPNSAICVKTHSKETP